MGARGMKDTTGNPQNQLTWAHRSSRRLNCQSGSLHGTNLEPLHVCNGCVAWSSCGNHKCGEMTQQLRALAALPIPSNHMVSDALFWHAGVHAGRALVYIKYILIFMCLPAPTEVIMSSLAGITGEPSDLVAWN